jgi:hypothetical protein
VLRRISEPKRDEAMRGWRELHNEELRNLYASPNIIKNEQVMEDEMDKPYNTNGGDEDCREDIGGKSRRKRPLGRPRHRLEDNIKMDLREIGWGDIDWIDLTQDRDQWRAFVNMVMNLRVP